MWNYLKSFGFVQCQVPTYEDSLQVSHFAPLCVWCVCVAGRKTWRLEMFPQQSLGAPASMGNKGCHPMAQNHLRETSSSLRCSLGTSTSWSFWFTKRLSSLADYILFFFPFIQQLQLQESFPIAWTALGLAGGGIAGATACSWWDAFLPRS